MISKQGPVFEQKRMEGKTYQAQITALLLKRPSNRLY